MRSVVPAHVAILLAALGCGGSVEGEEASVATGGTPRDAGNHAGNSYAGAADSAAGGAGGEITSSGAGGAAGEQGDPPDAAPAAICGDGITQGTERCDDGNTEDEDGCTTSCMPTCIDDATCDDRVICNGQETCDPTTHTCVAGEPADGQPCGSLLFCRNGKCIFG